MSPPSKSRISRLPKRIGEDAGPWMCAMQIGAVPKLLSAGGIEAGCAVGAELRVEAALLDHRRGSRIGVQRVDALRLCHLEELDVVNDPAAGSVAANREQAFAVRGGRGHPNLIAPDDRRGVAEVMDADFPADVFLLAPLQGGFVADRAAVARRTAKLRPVVSGNRRLPRRGGKQPRDSEKSGNHDERQTHAPHSGPQRGKVDITNCRLFSVAVHVRET